VAASYIIKIKGQDEVFKKYKEFVQFEVETHENVREGLEKVVTLKQS